MSQLRAIGWRLVQLEGRTILEHDGRENGVRTQVFVEQTREWGRRIQLD